MKTNVRIRTDGNSRIGLGHVIRCLAFAAMLKKTFSIKFYLCDSDVTMKDFLESRGFRADIITNEQTFFGDIEQNEIVVLDGYNFDTIYQQHIKNLEAFLICIDDLHDKDFVADVIINHAPGITRTAYKAESYTQFLLGSKYALLQPSFQRQASVMRRIEKVNRGLICFGGADSNNLTISTLNTILDDQRFSSIAVITGRAYAHKYEVDQIARKNGRIIHHHNISDDQMINLFLNAHLAIIPASGILFEVIACKTPAISGFYVDNQVDIYRGFKELGAFYDAGNFEPEKLRQAVENAFESDQNEMISRQAKCIDGKSQERYIDFFNSLMHDYSNSCR